MKQKQDVLFVQDENTKQFIKEISSLYGIKSEVVKEVLEYAAFVWILKIAENPEKLTTLTIPYLGNIGIRFKKDYINANGEMGTDIDAFLSVNESFTRIISDLNACSLQRITEYFKTNYIDKLCKQ